MARLWCGKIKLLKPYLGLVTKSRDRCFTSPGTLFHHQTLGQYTTVSSNVGQIVTLQTLLTSRETLEASVSDITRRNAVVKMYSLCGSVNNALKVFDEMPEKNFESWCVMMECFVDNGYGQEAMDFFTRFKREGNKPNGEMFGYVFSACTLTGDVDEGSLQFEDMRREFGIVPSMEHYHGCAKMLATSGHLNEALSFVERMPMEPSVDVWETLMNLSRVHGDLELGDRCAELVEKLDHTRLDKVSSAGLVSKASDFVKEEPSYRYILCKFRGTDTSHPEMDKIFETVKSLKSHMFEMGHVPDREEKMHKGERVFVHNEELMVINEILNSRPRSTVRVRNDVRIYPGCHDALKLMSKITGREVIKRDTKRFHIFRNGVCGCQDYW